MIQSLLHEAALALMVVTDCPRLEAEVLLAHALNKPRHYLHAYPEREITLEEIQRFQHFLARRDQQEPLAYILGRKEFWSLEFLVTRDTLIPRPETELLVEWITEHYSAESMLRVADLGTGCGAIVLALAHERQQWQCYATDISDAALAVAQENGQRLGVSHVIYAQGDWCCALPSDPFDIIVSNPPYLSETEWMMVTSHVAFEPRQALVSGHQGLDALNDIIHAARKYLKPNGYLLLEHGYSQGPPVRQQYAKAGYTDICSLRDLAGRERVTVGRLV